MEFATFKDKCRDIFAKNPSLPTPTEHEIELLFALTDKMLEVNKSMNLTAITDEDSIILKHYLHTLTYMLISQLILNKLDSQLQIKLTS